MQILLQVDGSYIACEESGLGSPNIGCKETSKGTKLFVFLKIFYRGRCHEPLSKLQVMQVKCFCIYM